MDTTGSWKKFKDLYFFNRDLDFSVDISLVNFPGNFFAEMEPRIQKAFNNMDALEKGDIVNPDEKRMVGHYWLRNPQAAPDAKIRQEIETTVQNIRTFAENVHKGKIAPPTGGKFQHVLLAGIGGSALGPQFVNQALSAPTNPMDIYFFDNTDPDGMDWVLSRLVDLSKTLVVIISKSGGTKETRNGQLIAKKAFESAGLNFAKHFVAVTGDGSELDKTAINENWLARFAMWDWVGGRTSELSAVGLLPAALQGFDIVKMLEGARRMDELTRVKDAKNNPAAMLALSWYQLGGGKGQKDMVILPYKDRLELFSRYLQQLVMESLGKEHDLDGKVVNQGIAVYGNKGSTDQHAYVQQLRDGVNNFYAVFIEVLKDKGSKIEAASLPEGFSAHAVEVESGTVSGDYLSGFYQGTRRALYEKNRESISLSINEVNEFTVGMLIALFERAVGLYATLVNINAYHQPGVEAGKKAAAEVLKVQSKVVDFLKEKAEPCTADDIAKGINADPETAFKILRHLGANSRVKIDAAASIFDDRYSF